MNKGLNINSVHPSRREDFAAKQRFRRWALDAALWAGGVAMAALLVAEALAQDRHGFPAGTSAWNSEIRCCRAAVFDVHVPPPGSRHGKD